MKLPEKSRIRRAFERAAGSYDQAAGIQREICLSLLDDFPAGHLPPTPRCILDAGCGTGFMLPRLAARFPASTILALDFAANMLQHSPATASRLQGDLENLPLADHSLDLYWSSLAVQWCDLPKVLGEAHRTLANKGCLALTTLGSNTFHELREAFAQADRYEHTLGFHPVAFVRETLVQAGFRDIHLVRKTRQAHHPDLRTLLSAVKAIGANQLGSGKRTGLLGRAAFRRAEAHFESLRTGAGLPLSYDVLQIHALA